MSRFAEEKDDDVHHDVHHDVHRGRRGNRVRAGFPVFDDDCEEDLDSIDGFAASDKGGSDDVQALKSQLAAMAARNKALEDELRGSQVENERLAKKLDDAKLDDARARRRGSGNAAGLGLRIPTPPQTPYERRAFTPRSASSVRSGRSLTSSICSATKQPVSLPHHKPAHTAAFP